MIYNSSKKHKYNALVVRPAMLSWSSRTGAYNREDWLMRWVLGCANIGCAPSAENLKLYLVPVDFMARGIIELSSSVEYLGNSYNIDNTSYPLKSESLFSYLAACAQCRMYAGDDGGNGVLHGILDKTSQLANPVHFSIWQDVVRREQKRLLSSSSDTSDKFLKLRKQFVAGLSMFLSALPADGITTWSVYHFKKLQYPQLDGAYVATLFDGLIESS